MPNLFTRSINGDCLRIDTTQYSGSSLLARWHLSPSTSFPSVSRTPSGATSTCPSSSYQPPSSHQQAEPTFRLGSSPDSSSSSGCVATTSVGGCDLTIFSPLVLTRALPSRCSSFSSR